MILSYFASLFFITVIAILFDTIKGRTKHSADLPHSNNVGKHKDASLNYKIPRTANPQGSTVSKNRSKNDIIADFSRNELTCSASSSAKGSTFPENLRNNGMTTVVSSKHPQAFELSCLAANTEGSTVPENPRDNDMIVSIKHLQESELSCFSINKQDSTVPKNPSNNDILLLSSEHLQASELSYPVTINDSFTKEPQHMISVTYTLPANNEASNLQEQSAMMDYKEEQMCSDVGRATTEDEEATCVQADTSSSDFEEVISHAQDEDDVTGKFGVCDI